MVQILPENPTFAQLLGRNIGSGLGSGVGKAAELSLKSYLQKGQNAKKNTANLSGFINKELKNRGLETYRNSKDLQNIYNKMLPLVESGLDPQDAWDQVFSSSQEETPTKQEQQQKSLGWTPAKGLFREGSFLREQPKEAAKAAGLGALEPLENMFGKESKAGREFMEKLGFTYKNPPREAWSSKKREELRSGLSEDHQADERTINLLSGLIPPETAALKLMSGARRGASALQNILGGARSAEGASAVAKAMPQVERSLAGRVGRQPETATEMRVARAEPQKKLHQTPKQAEIRERQLKNFPKYVEEIEADAAKRAAQAEAREPKTVKGRESRQIRQVEAQKNFEPARDSYQKAASRVRALEDQIARRPSIQKAEMQPILDMAKQELKEAEFAFKQATENLRGFSARAAIPEMREAARSKISQIQDALSTGEEYKIAKMDYNPEHIQEASRIGKKKALPTTRETDFYNDVHNTYSKEYRNRVDQIDKEIANLKKQHNMGAVQGVHQLQEEKGILDKMIKSADAEVAIHQHKFGLREMSERNKAAERLSHFEKVQGSPKVKQAATEKMWKNRIEDLKTANGRSRVAEEIVEDAAVQARSPEQAATIRAEKGRLNGALDEVAAQRAKIEENLKNPIKTPKEAKNKANKIVKDFQDMAAAFKKGGLEVTKTRMFKDIMVGMGTAIYDEFKKEYDLPLSPASLAAVFLGQSRGAGTRVAVNQFTKWLLKEYHLNQAKKAYLSHDEQKFNDFSPGIKKKAKERASR